MKREQKSHKPLRSVEEYRRRFFPQSSQKKKAEIDPKQLGLILADEVFEKAKPVLKGTVLAQA
ncbi:MAG TPA: hypothetical protein VL486_07300 [Verrucomicrobiae bacterium]|nr:hypothetical protein [Verrucomicrobiae bacterium]